MTIPLVLLVLVAITNFILSLTVLQGGRFNKQNFYFAAFMFAAVFWALGDAMMLYAKNSDVAYIGVLMFYVAPLVTTFFVLCFSEAFPANKPIKPWKFALYSIPLLVYFFGILLFPDFILKTIEITASGQNVITHQSLGYKIYNLYFNVYFFLAYIYLYRTLRHSSGYQKAQLRYTLSAVIVTSFLAVITNLLLPNLGIGQYVWAGPIFMIFFAIMISLAIVKHRLFDIRLIVVRSLTYLALIGVVGFLYGFLAFNAASLLTGGGTVSIEQRILFTTLAVGIAFTFQPLKKFLDKITNKFFYRDAYDPQALISNLNNVLIGNIELNNLLNSSSEIIGNTLKAEFCFFGIRETSNNPRRIVGMHPKEFNEEDISRVRDLTTQTRKKMIATDELTESQHALREVLVRHDISILVRLTDTPVKETEGLGYIILGPKKSGNPYSSQDQKVLEIIADEMVIAIQNALRFEEIQNFAETLQEKVDEATKNLRKANEKLKKLDETKDDFISMASHQLRTPLTSVKGYVSMVLEGDVGKISNKQRELLDQAFVSSQRMVYLIADLLNVSRLRTGKFIIEAKPTNLADVVEGEINQLTETAKGRGLKLTYKKPKDFPVLMLDETKIRQVIMNFADNAIYYTPSGGHIVVGLEDTGETVEFTVTDDGIGVPKEEQHHLFNKFYRAGNAKKARPDGTGLGLFMAKKVVVAQEGAIIFKTQEGKGSTFGFSFSKQKLLPEHYKGQTAQSAAEQTKS